MGVREGLVVALFHRGPKPDEMKLVATVDGHDQVIPVTDWRNCHAPFEGMDGADVELWAAKVQIRGLHKDEFDRLIERHLTRAHQQLTADTGEPVYHVWLGDQVYLDDPPVGGPGQHHPAPAHGRAVGGAGRPVHRPQGGAEPSLPPGDMGPDGGCRLHDVPVPHVRR